MQRARKTARLSYVGLVATVALAVSWAIAADRVVPGIIGDAYLEKSHPVLNGIIERPVAHPLVHYLQLWSDVSIFVLTALLVLGGALSLLAHPRLQRLAETRALAPRKATPMRRSRAVLVYGIAAILCAGHAYDVLLAREHWPFSDYSMYSGLRQHVLRPKRLFIVTDEGERPIHAKKDLPPFNESRLRRAFARLATGLRPETRVPAALEATLAYQSALQREGAVASLAAPTRGLRLYELEWLIEAGARNRNEPRSKRLLAEAMIE